MSATNETNVASGDAAGAEKKEGTDAAFASASLYVGDLNPDVTEHMLFEIFHDIGTVSFIRVCRDAVTRRSLGYAYVNFQNMADAKKAMDEMNGAPIKGKPCRIMWSQRDPSARKSGAGNIFIKNLGKDVDHKQLKDTFSMFGKILSCKIVTDDHGVSKGYGFVHYDNEESAKKAIEKVNGMKIGEKEVYVSEFIPRKERQKQRGPVRFTNVYVKELPDSIDTNEKLREMFEKFGPITSVYLATNEEKKSRGFGFVNFENAESAEKSVKEMNGTEVSHNGTTRQMFVGRAQKKAERQRELRRKMEQIKLDRITKYQGINVYVKNLEDFIDDEKLREEFQKFGTITSARVMVDEKKQSRGFGFVCFTTPDEATHAVSEMNGVILGNKPLYVALAQRKDDRRQQLEAQHARRKPMNQPGMYDQHQMYYQQGMGNPAGAQFAYTPQQMMPRGGSPQWNGRQAQQYGMNGQRYVMPVAQGQMQTRRPPQQQRMARGNVVMLQQPAQVQQLMNQPLDDITSLPLEQQKQVVGEKLFPLIAKTQPQLAGKITGMLLDSYFTEEIIHLIETPEALSTKIAEALHVLDQHSQSQN